jgi:hypothetical protein
MIINGIDCATRITKTVADKLKASGYMVAARYLPGTSKNMTAEEAQILSDTGRLILSVYETTTDRAKGGAVNGKADGIDALKLARALKMPEHGYIYFAVDYDAPLSDMPTIASYLQAAREAAQPYKIGVYGGYRVIEYAGERSLCAGYWQAYAWSYGKISIYATIRQISAPQTVAGISADLNEIYSYQGLWNYNTTAESIALSDKLQLNSPDYWGRVMQGKAALSPGNLKALMQKAAEYSINRLFE